MSTKFKDYRKTKQRKVILKELRKVCNHPTAEEIHKMVMRKIPNIGLATVYRNLDLMEKEGLILKLKSKNKQARYDGNTEKHWHLICKKCKQIIDIFDVKGVKINSQQLKKSGFIPSLDYLEISGLCKKCRL